MVAFASGIVASLALPPAGLWPALFVAFPVLALLLDAIDRQATLRPASLTRRFRAGFFCGWWFGFGYFVVSLYWIGAAFLVEADKFAILLPLAVAALPAGLAIFWGLAGGIAILLWRPGIHRLLVLTSVLTFMEWLRGFVFTGFPWNTIGYASTGMAGVEQLAAFSGLYGVSFFILICSLAPVLVVSRPVQPGNYVLAGFLLIALFATWFVGYQRALTPEESSSATGPMVRIVQANIDQQKKWDRAFRQKNIDKYFHLTQAGPSKNPHDLNTVDIVVWPETALPALYDENPVLQKRVADLLPQNTSLLMGAMRREGQGGAEAAKPRYFNSVMAINSDGRIDAIYDKFHLVPFGEYLPGEKWLAPLGLRKIVPIPASFSTGSGPRSLKIRGLPAFSPLICYEIAFSAQIINHDDRPKWIVNVTNDGWFGRTAGPYQHLEQARFRAIEQGLPVVRAANTGISALFDAYGNVIDSLPLGKTGVIDARLPKPIPPTIYARYGTSATILQILVMLNILMILAHLLTNIRKPS